LDLSLGDNVVELQRPELDPLNRTRQGCREGLKGCKVYWQSYVPGLLIPLFLLPKPSDESFDVAGGEMVEHRDRCGGFLLGNKMVD
jgi:hypothetical protein